MSLYTSTHFGCFLAANDAALAFEAAQKARQEARDAKEREARAEVGRLTDLAVRAEADAAEARMCAQSAAARGDDAAAGRAGARANARETEAACHRARIGVISRGIAEAKARAARAAAAREAARVASGGEGGAS